MSGARTVTPTSRRCRGSRWIRCTGRRARRCPASSLHEGALRVDVPLEALDDAPARRLRDSRGQEGPFEELFRSGVSGLFTAFAMPTLMGRDSDDPLSEGGVGRAGAAVDMLADVEDLFTGAGTPPAGHVRRVTDKTGMPRAALSGTLQNNIRKEYQAQKEFIFPPRPSLRLVSVVVQFCAAELPRWHPVSISGHHIREAGSTAAQELAFWLGNGFAYVEAALAAGLSVDLRDRYGATHERSLLIRFHTQTAGVSFTAQTPGPEVGAHALDRARGATAWGVAANGSVCRGTRGVGRGRRTPTGRPRDRPVGGTPRPPAVDDRGGLGYKLVIVGG